MRYAALGYLFLAGIVAVLVVLCAAGSDARTFMYKDPQGFFQVQVKEETYQITSPGTDQQAVLHVFSPLKPGKKNHPVLALNGGGHSPLYFTPFGMRFVARGIPFCTIGWPGYEENDVQAMTNATFASVIALYESAAAKVTQLTGKKPVGYFWSMGGIVLSNIKSDVIAGALTTAPSPPPNMWGPEAFEELKKRYPAGKYIIDFTKPVNFPALKAYWDDSAQLLEPAIPRIGEQGKGPFMSRDEYATYIRPFPPKMFAVISDYHYLKDEKLVRWYAEDLKQALDYDGHALPPTYIITGLQDWRHAPDTYAADHKLWSKMKYVNNDLTVEYWDRASHTMQIQPAVPKLVNSFIYWMKIHGWAQ
jgi:hypothetical protein